MQQDTNHFITQSQKRHGDRYDYSVSEYIGVKNQINIICKKHGMFSQQAGNHMRGSGCPECKKDVLRKGPRFQVAQQTFINDCKIKHNDFYDYSKVNYTAAHDYINVVCPKHGEFSLLAYAHKQGRGCRKCWSERNGKIRTKPIERFIAQSVKIHGEKYSYEYTSNDYRGNKVKVQIICKEHGPFFQRPEQHIRGEGCPECGKISWWTEQGGYSERYFDENPTEKTKMGIIYLVEFTNETERFFKIGITRQTLKERFHWGYNDYEMDILSTKTTTIYEAWQKEQQILQTFKSCKYIPQIKIGGYTECLQKHVDVNEIKRLM